MLSHGPVSVGRTFSLNNIIHNFNIKEISSISRKLIIDHMKSNFLSLHTFPATKLLLKSVRSSQQRYGEHLKEEQTNRNENYHSAQIEIITNEILEIKKPITECNGH